MRLYSKRDNFETLHRGNIVFNLGFRAGLTYMPENLDIRHSAGIPVYFAWRLLTQGGEPIGFTEALDDDPYYESYYNNYEYNRF